eukprot:9715473-Alexandrium_andersonii.AAC.1
MTSEILGRTTRPPLTDQAAHEGAPEVPDDAVLKEVAGTQLANEGELVDRELLGAELLPEASK